MENKIIIAKITKSKMYPSRVSIRGETTRDIRQALTDAGFKPGDRVVIALLGPDDPIWDFKSLKGVAN